MSNPCATTQNSRKDLIDKKIPDDDGKPKRPLSAYNMFFRDERVKLLANRPVRPEGVPRRGHGKMGFAEMARTISAKWNTLDAPTKRHYEHLGRREKALYRKRLAEWKLTSKEQNPGKSDKPESQGKQQIENVSVPMHMNKSAGYREQLRMNHIQKNGNQQMEHEQLLHYNPQPQSAFNVCLSNWMTPGSHLPADKNVAHMLMEQAKLISQISGLINSMTDFKTTTEMVAPRNVMQTAAATPLPACSAPTEQSQLLLPNNLPQQQEQYQQSIFHPTSFPCSYHGVDIDCVANCDSDILDHELLNEPSPASTCIAPLSSMDDFPVDSLQNLVDGIDYQQYDFSKLFENDDGL